jgi:hypothetical protein
MKNIISLFKNLESFSFLIGMMFGSALGLVLFSYLVPGGTRMIGMYRSNKLNTMIIRNQQAMQDLYPDANQATDTPRVIQQATRSSYNPYVVGRVTSERQFLEQMKLHHEADVLMATQLLLLTTSHPETKTLAKNIISEQTTELKMLRDWLISWK